MIMSFNLKSFLLIISLVLNCFGVDCDSDSEYAIGVGIADITGPAAEINMMGYANLKQNTAGIHIRQYARTVIISYKNGTRICFVSCDIAMTSQIVKLEVIKALEAKYNGIYSEPNVMLSSTHTHSGSAGFLQYVVYIITSQGFIRQSHDAIVSGIVKSIDMAHNTLTAGRIYINSGQLLDASINRSPTAYANNPENEKMKYSYDTDKEMTVLKLVAANGTNLGVISWFAVHCTSMNNTNKLISGDNKGYASQLFEQYMNGGTLHGKGAFVALFPQSNEGDVSPNINGPHCTDTGLPCDIATSTCDGQNEKCVGSGPGKDMFESTQIIGARQFNKAKELYDTADTELTGNIKFIHQNLDMSNVEVVLDDNSTVHTCKPAMGYSFAAGTTDGPGDFDFKQGDTSPSPFWTLVRDFIKRPSDELVECQRPKPILLATGEMSFPYAWQPSILPNQIFQIGNLLIAAVPAEFSTMAGRRLRDSIKKVYDSYTTNSDVNVVISGLSNAYSSYVTTYEEYQIQRYEGASTLYGPYTLDAYIQQFEMLTSNLAADQVVSAGPDEPNLMSKQICLKPGVIYDGTPFRRNFGDVISDANDVYRAGDTVVVSFVSGNPRNDLQTDSTFLSVEQWDNSTQQWLIIATDANWETKFFWQRTNTFFGESQVIITWDIPQDISDGAYRVRHFGHSKNLLQQISSYTGVSKTFSVKSSAKK